VKTRNASLLFLLLPLAVALLFGWLFIRDAATTYQETNRSSIARVSGAARTVQREAARTTVWENVFSGLPLYPQDTVRTGNNSAVQITMTTGDVIQMGPNSLMQVYVNRDGDNLLQLKTGSLRVLKTNGKLKVRSGKGKAIAVAAGSAYNSKAGEVIAAEPAAQQTAVQPSQPAEQTAQAASAAAPAQDSAVEDMEQAAPAAEPVLLVAKLPLPVKQAVPEAPAAPLPQAAPVKEAAQPAAQLAAVKEVVPVKQAAPPPPVKLKLNLPENLSPAQGAVLGRSQLAVNGGVKFTWNPVPDAVSYTWTLLGPDGAAYKTATVEACQYLYNDVPGLVKGRSFVWTVSANASEPPDERGYSAGPPAQSSFSVLLTPLASPEALPPQKTRY
jgi:hypothetical protein